MGQQIQEITPEMVFRQLQTDQIRPELKNEMEASSLAKILIGAIRDIEAWDFEKAGWVCQLDLKGYSIQDLTVKEVGFDSAYNLCITLSLPNTKRIELVIKPLREENLTKEQYEQYINLYSNFMKMVEEKKKERKEEEKARRLKELEESAKSWRERAIELEKRLEELEKRLKEVTQITNKALQFMWNENILDRFYDSLVEDVRKEATKKLENMGITIPGLDDC